ncbi:MAG: hypothetical protein ACJAUP_001363 [Cellvibrionaceae bacterium]|jgi:hypothetical protein
MKNVNNKAIKTFITGVMPEAKEYNFFIRVVSFKFV